MLKPGLFASGSNMHLRTHTHNQQKPSLFVSIHISICGALIEVKTPKEYKSKVVGDSAFRFSNLVRGICNRIKCSARRRANFSSPDRLFHLSFIDNNNNKQILIPQLGPPPAESLKPRLIITHTCKHLVRARETLKSLPTSHLAVVRVSVRILLSGLRPARAKWERV